MTSLTNSENPSWNPLQGDCSGFQVAAKKLFQKSPVIQETFSKAGQDMYTGENKQMIAKEEKTKFFLMRLSEQSYELGNVFWEASRNVVTNFFFQKTVARVKNVQL